MFTEKSLIIILIIALVVIGPTQLPKLAKMFGKSAKAMRDGMEGKDVDEEEPAPKPKAKAKTDDEDSSDEV